MIAAKMAKLSRGGDRRSDQRLHSGLHQVSQEAP
jgi:hypothetical protein